MFAKARIFSPSCWNQFRMIYFLVSVTFIAIVRTLGRMPIQYNKLVTVGAHLYTQKSSKVTPLHFSALK